LTLSPPQPLAPGHHLEDFACGERVLDDWLQRRALGNQFTGASRTFVVVDEDQRVLGFYALAAGAIALHEATGAVRRNMPDPIPVMVLGRLAVDRRAQGRGLGPALLKDAVHRAISVSRNTGVRALLVHALHEKAKNFYEHYGFKASPQQPMTLMLRLDRGTG
jgi:GNAT superfamily N-acetyltransferase